jgi:peptidyl-prolyl cis-trans isomerase SurA
MRGVCWSLLLASALIAAPLEMARAEQGILATVNDVPITSLDITQHQNLVKLLGGRVISRKDTLNDMIDEVVKINEATRYKINPTERDLDARLGDIAKGLKTDRAGLGARLKKQGISEGRVKQYFEAQISFARLLRYKFKDKVEVKDADVDRKMGEIKADIGNRVAKVMADPRMKPIKAFSLMEVLFPIEGEVTPELLQARALEASQFVGRFKDCKSAKSAASGIFNVQVSKPREVDSARLPPQLAKALANKGPGGAIGPMRAGNAIQVVGFCGQRTIKPPAPDVKMPSREMVAQSLMNEKFDSVEKKYMGQMRKNAVIEYKDPSFSQ